MVKEGNSERGNETHEVVVTGETQGRSEEVVTYMIKESETDEEGKNRESMSRKRQTGLIRKESFRNIM